MGIADSGIRFDLFSRDQTKAGIQSAESSFGKFGKGLVTKFAAAGAAIGGISLLGDFISEAQESAKVGRLTANVIKSTGGAARVSADDVGRLATSISNKVGVDDEAIQSGSNLLLTFTNIRNEVGKGNDIFNQANRAAVDMAAGLNNGKVTAESLKGTSVQLGKALNDPIKGITALTRSGVSFTDAQKKQITEMVKAGDTLGAQKVILGELKKEFGGAAAAAASPAEKAQVAWGNLKEQIGTGILPLFNKVAAFAADKLIPAISTGVEKVGPIFKDIGKGVSTFWSALTGKSEANEFDGKLKAVNNTGVKIGNWIRNDFLPVAKQLASWFRTQAIPAVTQFAQKFWTALQPAIAQIGKSLRQDLLPAVQGAIGKFKEAWPSIQRVLTILGQVAGFIITKVVPVLIQFYGKYLATLIKVNAQVFAWMWKIVGVLIDVGEAYINAGQKVGEFVAKVANGVKATYNAVKDGIGKVITFYREMPGRILTALGDLASTLYQKGRDLIDGFGRGALEAAKSLPFGMGKVVGLAVDGIQKAQNSHSPAKITQPLGKDFVDGYSKGIDDNAKKPAEAVERMVDNLKEKLAAAKDFAQSIRDTFRTATDLTSIDTMLTDARGNERDGGLAQMIAGLQKRAADATKFADTITKLRKAGLNAASLENLRSAGPDGGLTAAQNLLAGGSSAIQQVNQLTKQINQTARDFADRETRATYGYTGTGDMSAREVRLVLDLRSDDRELLERLRRQIRVKGGNVQVVLGGQGK